MIKIGSRRARRGNAALMGALMLAPMSMLAGVGIDFGRTYVAQSRMSSAVDAAALAGGRKLSVSDTSADARSYFDANFNAAAEAVTVSSFTSTPTDNNNLLTVEAKGTIDTTFLKLAGLDTLPISASATARRTTLGMELALVLDVTGSMDGGDAIGKLKVAARSLVDILFGDKTSMETLYVSVVPFTASVNFGIDKTNWLVPGSLDQTKFSPHVWRGCVEARTTPEDELDTPPIPTAQSAASQRYTPYLYKSTIGAAPAAPNDNEWNTTNKLPSDRNLTAAKDAFSLSDSNTGPNLGCGQPMAGLDNNRDNIRRVIAALRTSHRAGTMIPTGLQAGWATLSPKWRGLWGTNPWGSTTPAGFPLDYETPYMQKVLLLITDGDNNWNHPNGNPQPDYTAYGRISDKRLSPSISTSAAAKTELNARTSRMCERIKANKIIIYTITTGSVAAATKTIFRNCATSPSYFYDAPSATQLNAIFTQIGSQLSNLRLEK